ncbi:MAG: hypothetical protein JNK85_04375 [Verrucomicrobiales bacterium]|nr:hypothetical protein [Verrucomicrobiales bacterium]
MNLRSLLISAMLLPGTSPSIRAQAIQDGGGFQLTGAVVGGGGAASSDTIHLVGAVPSGGSGFSTGGSYTLRSGAVAVVRKRPSIAPVVLTARWTPNHDTVLEWSGDASGYILEFSASVGADALWSPVSPQPSGTSVTVTSLGPVRFFRLRRP